MIQSATNMIPDLNTRQYAVAVKKIQLQMPNLKVTENEITPTSTTLDN